VSKVSVIIPAFNAAAFLKEAIDSILQQTYKDIEIIVVDDGSTDNTRSIVESFGDRIIYIHQQNSGHAIARNTGLKRATGRYFAFLDSDDVWLPEKIKRQVKILEANADAGIVHCDIVKVDLEGNEIKKYPRKIKYFHGNMFPYILTRRGHIATSSAIFKKECIERCGYLDETVREWGSEDREFWLRLCKHFKVEYIDKPLVKYRLRSKSLSRSRDLSNVIKGRCWAVDKSLKYFEPFYYAWYLKRTAYNAIFKEIAYESLLDLDFKESMRYYVKTILIWPFDRSPWIGLVRSLLKIRITRKYQ